MGKQAQVVAFGCFSLILLKKIFERKKNFSPSRLLDMWSMSPYCKVKYVNLTNGYLILRKGKGLQRSSICSLYTNETIRLWRN
mgnify:CR=1 FL=1